MSLLRSDDPRTIRERVITALVEHPEGLQSKELAQMLGQSQPVIAGQCSRLASYGCGIVRAKRGKLNIWRFAPGKVK